MGIVRQAYAAFNRGDVDAAFESLAPEFECDMSRAVGGNVSLDTYDLVQFRGLVDEYASSWESFQLGADEFIDAGDHVVVPFTNRARSRTLGVEMEGAALRLDDSRRNRLQGVPLPRTRRSPRSRRAVGVGRVGGERRGGAPVLRGPGPPA